MMTTAKKIANRIEELPMDSTFGYADLSILREEYLTAAKALERLQKRELLKNCQRGFL